MDSIFVLLLLGFMVGSLGTLIGAGGGFILVPVLLLTHPDLPPDILTAVSMAIVAANALSGSVAYARSGRIDFKAGLLFAAFTIPGSILGVYATSYIPKAVFHFVFGVLLIVMAVFLFISKKQSGQPSLPSAGSRWRTHRIIVDREGIAHDFHYNRYLGILISVVVGFISPLLGIGGGIIHVPALVNWLNFPVPIATATSHFILAVMSTVSVITHLLEGNYSSPAVTRMVLAIGTGAVVGAQVGAMLSHRIKGNIIIRTLAVCLAVVGIRIMLV